MRREGWEGVCCWSASSLLPYPLYADRNYLLLLKFAATAAVTVEEPGAESGAGSSDEEAEAEGVQQQQEGEE